MKVFLYILLFAVIPSFVFAQTMRSVDMNEGTEREKMLPDTIVMDRLDVSEPVVIDSVRNVILIFPNEENDKECYGNSEKIFYTQERFLRSNRMLAIHWTDKTPQCYLLSWSSVVAVKMQRISSTVLQLTSLSESFSLTIESAKYEDYE